jgi:hypothetical protein
MCSILIGWTLVGFTRVIDVSPEPVSIGLGLRFRAQVLEYGPVVGDVPAANGAYR